MQKLMMTLALCVAGWPVSAQDAEPPMTMARLGQILLALDPEAQASGNAMEFSIEGIPVIVIADPTADRMRAMVPIRSSEGMSQQELLRVMQANFDSALDARYAVAQGRLFTRCRR